MAACADALEARRRGLQQTAGGGSAVRRMCVLAGCLLLLLAGCAPQTEYTHTFFAMDTVCSLKQEDAEIVVTNIYNPVANLKLPSTMNQVVEDIIKNMNGIIDDHAAEYGYAAADLVDSDISGHVQKDGLHPDQEGQRLIADIVCEEYKTLSQE